MLDLSVVRASLLYIFCFAKRTKEYRQKSIPDRILNYNTKQDSLELATNSP